MKAMKHLIYTLALLGLLFSVAGVVHADAMADLKESFRKRYPTLTKLQAAGKVGETHAGMVAVVRPEYAGEKVSETEKVSDVVAAENADRGKLYAAIARQQQTTPEVVAQRNAKRNFDKAGAEEFLLTSKNQWVQKKNLKPEDLQD